MFASIEQSALDHVSSAPFLQKPLSHIDTACSVFGFIPEDDDPRWAFLSRYASVKAEAGFNAMNFTNAWGAVYLSGSASYHSGYVNTLNEPNCLQLHRALDNLNAQGSVQKRYASLLTPSVTLSITDAISNDSTAKQRTATPCPEALYQLRLADDIGYLARVGFNCHNEAGRQVLSLVNIQGVPNGSKRNRDFERQMGVAPFNYLARCALSLASTDQDQPMAVRGLLNPKRGNSQLYWGVLESEGIDMYKASFKEAEL